MDSVFFYAITLWFRNKNLTLQCIKFINMRKFLAYLFANILIIGSSFAQKHYVGGDISLIPAYEEAKDVYLSYDGTKISDLIIYLKETCEWNSARVRLFVEPNGKDHNGKTDHAVCQDLEYVVKLGKRIKDAGMAFMLDFHYTDTWADPSYQQIPSRWPKDNEEVLADSLYNYTKNCLSVLSENGVKPDFVQIGNEISYGMLLRNDKDKVFPSQDKSKCASQWERLSNLLNKASKAVREACPEAKIIIHTERSGEAAQSANFYTYIKDVDYDIIGLSYYPFWHNDLKALGKTIESLTTTIPDKKIQIVETAYYHQYFPSDATYKTTNTWSADAKGQYNYVKDLIDELLKHNQVDGLYYWFPEECGNGYKKTVIEGWVNRGLWEDGWQVEQHKPITITAGQNDGALYIMKTFANNKDIESIESSIIDNKNNHRYNLSGQKIDNINRGELYIQNGKKYISK